MAHFGIIKEIQLQLLLLGEVWPQLQLAMEISKWPNIGLADDICRLYGVE